MAKSLEVDTDRQILPAFEDGAKVFTFDGVTGDSSHLTPRGDFHIFKKDRTHFSGET